MSAVEVDAGRHRLAVSVDGEEGRPWLLLSNSLAADMRMWDDQIGVLTRTHRVLRYDTRGHGGSEAPAGPYDFAGLVGDMVALLDHFGIERADVMGLSLGGMTAIGLALSHPERVGRLVVCDARADAPPPFVASWDQRIEAIGKGGMAAVVSGTLDRWFSPGCPQSVRDRAEAMILATSPEGYIGCAHALKTLDYLNDLGRIAPPTLYVVGSDDQGAPKEAMAEMAARTPGASLAVLEGLAHVPNMEAPDVFAGAVEPFLAGRTHGR